MDVAEAEIDQLANTESLPELPSRGAIHPSVSGIERFTLLRRLGQGGMGTVYAAYDSVLDRKVALKVVRADRRRAPGVSPRDQLMREAQAMARLSHPNVIAVHEVGELANDVYVVMELVDGATLHDWLRERERPWREIVAAFVQAGRGLAAAHDEGLVHRDFKPHNVLVRRDGRIQVTDFGVVSMGGSSSDTSEPRGNTSAAEITFTGRRVGTLAFMAPEQHAGSLVDGRADQFSFAVALWEALSGRCPFVGTQEQRFDAIRAGRIDSPIAGVPKHIEVALRRALAADPAARWGSMEELLDELVRDPQRQRRRRLVFVAGTAVVAAAIAVACLGWTRDDRDGPPPCSGMDSRLAGTWDRHRADAVRSALAGASSDAYGSRITGQLDAWADRWLAARADACRATRVIGEQSEALLDARMHCLDRQLDEVDQLATALGIADRRAIARFVEGLALPDVAACADRDFVTVRVPPASPALRVGVLQIEHQLAAIRAQERSGRYHDARARAERVVADAQAIGFGPVLAEALLLRGQLEDQVGDLVAARATLADAARVAASASDDRTLARTLVTLVGVLVAGAETDAALGLAIAATAAVARVADVELEAELAEQLGAAHDALGHAEAETHLARALALRERSGRDSLAVAQVLSKLAAVWARRGRSLDARAAYERAFQIAKAELGDDHPATAVARANVCYLDAQDGKLDQARACQERALATLEHALGGDHTQVAWALNEVALVQREQGDVVGAERRFVRALEIWERVSGPSHPDVAWPAINLGEIANERGDHARAEALCRRALAVLEHAKPGGTDSFPALVCVAEAVLPSRPREATDLVRRALELARTTEETATLTFLLARCEVATGDRRTGVATARRALASAGGDLRATIESWLGQRPATRW